MQTGFKTKSFILALLIIIGLIFLNLPSVSSKIKDFFHSALLPIQKEADHIVKEIKNHWKTIQDIQQLSRQNLELEQEVQQLKAKNAKLQEIKQENQFLQSSLELVKKTDYELDLATIIGHGFQGIERYFLIDKGSSAGIKKNMPVIVYENILVGKIIEVFQGSSKVLLTISPNSKIPALIQESRIQGLIKGTKKKTLFLDLVPKNSTVEIGDRIVTSGLGGIFPKGILIGEILTIENFEHEIFQQITIQPAVDLEELEQVFIIKK